MAQSAVVNEEVKALESWYIELPLGPNLNLGMFALLGLAVWEKRKQMKRQALSVGEKGPDEGEQIFL